MPDSHDIRPTDFLNSKGRYECSECPNSYRHFKHLKRHLNSHTHEVNYDCEDCGRRFSRSDLLQRHRRRCAMSDDERVPYSRPRRTRRQRPDSGYSSPADDSDHSVGAYGVYGEEPSNHSESRNSRIPSADGSEQDLNRRRSSRQRSEPLSYAEGDMLPPPHPAYPQPPSFVADLQKQRAAKAPYPASQYEPDFLYGASPEAKVPQEWFQQMVAPETPPAHNPPVPPRSVQGTYDSQYFSERYPYEEPPQDKPEWTIGMDQDMSSQDSSHPSSPAWESANSAYQQAVPVVPVQSFQTSDDKLPSIEPPQDSLFDTIFVDEDNGGLLSTLSSYDLACTGNFMDDIWSASTDNFVF